MTKDIIILTLQNDEKIYSESILIFERVWTLLLNIFATFDKSFEIRMNNVLKKNQKSGNYWIQIQMQIVLYNSIQVNLIFGLPSYPKIAFVQHIVFAINL